MPPRPNTLLLLARVTVLAVLAGRDMVAALICRGSDIPGSPLNSCVEEEVTKCGRCEGRMEEGPRVADFDSLLGEEGALNELTRVTPMLRAIDFCLSCEE